MPLHPPRGGGPRQRFLPTPRGVNMIVWSLDNRFVLAAIMGKYYLQIFPCAISYYQLDNDVNIYVVPDCLDAWCGF